VSLLVLFPAWLALLMYWFAATYVDVLYVWAKKFDWVIDWSCGCKFSGASDGQCYIMWRVMFPVSRPALSVHFRYAGKNWQIKFQVCYVHFIFFRDIMLVTYSLRMMSSVENRICNDAVWNVYGGSGNIRRTVRQWGLLIAVDDRV